MREVRLVTGERLELREGDNGVPMIEGYAAVFNRLSEPLNDFWGGTFREKIAPGAFKKTIQEADVRALFNHDPNIVLGRNTSGTLTLREDDHGLHMSVTPPDTSWARDLATSIKRGDVSQQSFAFMPVREEWTSERNKETGKRVDIRTLMEVRLFDVSPVTYPAYSDTSVSARAAGRLDADDTDELQALIDVLARRRRGMELDSEDSATVTRAIARLQSLIPAPGEPHAGEGDAEQRSGPDIVHLHELRRRKVALLERLANMEGTWH